MKISYFKSFLIGLGVVCSSFRSGAQTYNESINQIAQSIKVDSIEKTITALQSHQSRFLLNPNRLDIAMFLKTKLISYGYENTRIDTFQTHIEHQSGLDTIVTQYNVVATLPGSGASSEKIVYGAHYDSFSTDTNPLITAPGADDNASGTAAVLETARVIKTSAFTIPQTLEFVLFAAEEYLLSCKSGSEYHAEQAMMNNDHIVLMINNDMISYNDGTNSICFSNYPSSYSATRLAIFSSENYSTLNYCLWPSNWSPFADVEPFVKMGAQGVYFEESYFNPYYHTSNDIKDHIDFAYCAEVAKISCATILSFNSVTSVDVELYNNRLYIYPNPSSDFINVLLSNNERIIKINIVDITGRLVYTSDEFENQSLNISNYNSGTYFIKIKTSKKEYNSRFIKN